jgi:hypothetical protein
VLSAAVEFLSVEVAFWSAVELLEGVAFWSLPVVLLVEGLVELEAAEF